MIEISFSQAQTWNNCRKAWAYRYVDKRKGIPSLPAVRGNRYHSAIENALNAGRMPENPILARAVEVINRLEWDSLEPEKYVEYVQDDLKIRGYADVVGKKAELNYVVDWKFPGKHPGGTAKKDYLDQINLYSFMFGFNDARLIIVYPEHDVAFASNADPARGEKVAEKILVAAGEIKTSGALEIYGKDQEPTYNWTCKQYCDHRDVCPLGG